MNKILVVEDDQDTRDIYATILAHHGYTVLQAGNGSEGVRIAQESQPDLIVMNVSMPRLDGLSATALLRRDPRTAAIPIIACTGYVLEDGGDRAEDVGCDAYLEKPCEPSRLVEEVARVIGRPVPAA